MKRISGATLSSPTTDGPRNGPGMFEWVGCSRESESKQAPLPRNARRPSTLSGLWALTTQFAPRRGRAVPAVPCHCNSVLQNSYFYVQSDPAKDSEPKKDDMGALLLLIRRERATTAAHDGREGWSVFLMPSLGTVFASSFLSFCSWQRRILQRCRRHHAATVLCMGIDTADADSTRLLHGTPEMFKLVQV